ncbi:MAG: proprotein convertase P-domain-containing protein [Erythrobacter sp.]|uniref:proprotein convertase P-domain-containing protein n=1 Tax=Erythrobacter sp. TaxID=1042 RepID=UPI0032ED93A2
MTRERWQRRIEALILAMARLMLAALCLSFSQAAMAQATFTYSVGNNGAIDDDTPCSDPLVRTFTVTDSFTVADVDFGFYARHSWRGDMRITLQAPDGTRVQLVDGDATSTSGNNLNALLDDDAAVEVNSTNPTGNQSTANPPPFANTFAPNAPLSAFIGVASAGTWRMEVCDIFPSVDDGQFRYAELRLTSLPADYADLSLTKSLLGAPPVSGGTATWRLTVTNAADSPVSADGIVVRDTLPGGFSFASASGDGSFDAASGDWTIGTLAPGQSAILTISGTIASGAGTLVTNIAEITASSAPDIDSTPGNAITTEDDYAASTFTVQSGRAPGIPPALSCPAGSAIFDWDTISGWTPGSENNSYAFASFGTIGFALTNDGAYLNNPTFGGQSPTVDDAFTGGLSVPEASLVMLVDQPSRAGEVELVISLPQAFTGIQFKIFDIDFFGGQFADNVEVSGRLGASTILPTLSNGNVNVVSGNVITGDGGSDTDEALGNAVVTFTQAVDTIVIRYGNAGTAPANPGQQAIAIHDITVCNPFARLSVTKVSSVISDPVNGTTDPKAIPGALVEYLITVSNTGTDPADADSVVVIDNGPADAKMCRIGRAGGPVIFADSGGGSGLSYSFAGLAQAGDDLEFSSDDGASWAYVPSADGEGCDTSITDFRVRPGGAFAGGETFTLTVRFIVE